jgi:hypothetical protein
MSSSESESDYEQTHHEDVSSEVHEEASSSPAPKASKLSFEETLENNESLLLETSEIFNELSELEKDYEKNKKELQARLRKNLKKLKTDSSKFVKMLGAEMKSAKKKKKSSGNSTGGFNKPVPVPKKLCSYLDIDEDELPRPAVSKLLNAKFKEKGFRDGKIVTITGSKDAKALGVKKGHVIEFKDFQTFLAKFYNEESANANV